MPAVQLFISCVSNEFGTYRDGLRRDLDRYNLTAKIQEDFMPYGTPVLDKLDDYIRSCDAVIHLAGDMTGATVGMPSVNLIASRYPDLVNRMPFLKRALAGDEQLSFTQCEAYLAIYHHKALYIASPTVEVQKDMQYENSEDQKARQRQHLQRLKSLGHHAEIQFRNPDHLVAALYRSKLLDLLQTAGKKAIPNNLPYRSIGKLFKGREPILEQLHNSLYQQDGTGASTITTSNAFYGLGGIGKTRLAVEYAWRYKPSYKALFYVFAENPKSLPSSDL